MKYRKLRCSKPSSRLHEVNQKVIAFIDQIVAECGKPKHDYVSFAVPEELFEAIQKIVTPEEMEVAVFTDDKQTREENIRKITEKLEEAFADNEEWLAKLGEAVYQYQKKVVRKMNPQRTTSVRTVVQSKKSVHLPQKLT